MSLLGNNTPEESPAVVPEIEIVHCTNCGKDYYVQVMPGQTLASIVNDMSCTCDNSQLVKSEVPTINHTEVEQS